MDTNKYKVILTETAIDDIDQSYEYISQNLCANKAAENLMLNINRKIMQLEYSPKMHMKMDKCDRTKRFYRRIVVNNYVILYTIDEQLGAVYISHMYYSRRNYLF